jgi:hypothetical protein
MGFSVAKILEIKKKKKKALILAIEMKLYPISYANAS